MASHVMTPCRAGFALLAAIAPSAAFPSYRLKVPMGNKVACFDGATGCRPGMPALGEPTTVCQGLGHKTCAGADFPLNPFGLAMEASGFEWTQELCQADSDGDGQTNGEELGDPCCVWILGQSDTAYMMGFSPSHPGFADSKQGSEYASPSCSGDEPAPPMEQVIFNSGEEQRHVDFRIKNYTIPSKRTTYVNFIFNFNDEDHDLFHIVLGEALVDQPRHLHHYLVDGYPDRISAELEGVPLPSDLLPQWARGPGLGQSGWAPGSTIWTGPLNAGTPVGKAAGIRSFKVNVHFTDGDLHPGTVSQDGLRVYYTPTLREYAVDTSRLIWVATNKNMIIPPGASRWFVTRMCEVADGCEDASDEFMFELTAAVSGTSASCSQLAQWGFCNHEKYGRDVKRYCPGSCSIEGCSAFRSDGTLPVVGINYHGHLLGTEMYLTLTRNNTVHNLGSTSVWHYDDQQTFDLVPHNVSLRPGDVLQSTCVYNSMSRSGMTYFHIETEDEMCIHNLFTLRHNSMPQPNLPFHCHGNAWTGQLSPDEDALSIATIHPWQTGGNVWEPNVAGSVSGEPLLATHLCPVGSEAMPDSCAAGFFPEPTCCAHALPALPSQPPDGPIANCMVGTVLVGLRDPCYLANDGTVKYTFMCCTPFSTTLTTLTTATGSTTVASSTKIATTTSVVSTPAPAQGVGLDVEQGQVAEEGAGPDAEQRPQGGDLGGQQAEGEPVSAAGRAAASAFGAVLAAAAALPHA